VRGEQQLDASQARWAALGVAASVLSSRVKFGLVFHTEGLINEKVVGKLKEFSLELHGEFKPTLAVITPLCPQYYIDPLVDPVRRQFTAPRASGADAKYADRLRELSNRYDIGYHGHFFEATGGKFTYSFDESTVTDQFGREYQYLKEIGFAPTTYAGGWWHISPHIVSLLERYSFKLDTTINDVLTDSFDQTQPYTVPSPGVPFWIGDQTLEVQSVRSFQRILKGSVLRSQRERFFVLSLHDYDLMQPGVRNAVKTISKLAGRGAMLAADELHEQAARSAAMHRATGSAN
jgi:hypothetical protein